MKVNTDLSSTQRCCLAVRCIKQMNETQLKKYKVKFDFVELCELVSCSHLQSAALLTAAQCTLLIMAAYLDVSALLTLILYNHTPHLSAMFLKGKKLLSSPPPLTHLLTLSLTHTLCAIPSLVFPCREKDEPRSSMY